MPVVRFAAGAVADIAAIRTYIAEEGGNPAAAAHEAERIRRACRSLDVLPRRGRLSAVPGTFEKVAEPYIITYEVQGEEVTILAVEHGARRA